MKFIYTDSHKLHFPQTEYHRGEIVTPFEKPERIDLIMHHLELTLEFNPIIIALGACIISFLGFERSTEWLCIGQ